MELRHLRYFAAVAEELHFARAAARLNISAPTLSHQISALEAMLGAKLLTRKTKSAVALTHAGKRFLIEALETLTQAARAEMVGRRAARGEAGSIAVGYVLSAACSGLVASSIVEFRTLHPDVSFQLRRMETFPQLRELSEDSLDIGFTRGLDRYPAGLAGFVADRQPYWLAVPEAHPLARKKHITPAMLADAEFVAAPMQMEVGFWGNIAATTPPGVSVKIVERAPDAFTVLTLVAAGFGVSVLSESLKRVAIPGVVYRKISGATRQADHAVVYRKNESAPVVKIFIDLLRRRARGV